MVEIIPIVFCFWFWIWLHSIIAQNWNPWHAPRIWLHYLRRRNPNKESKASLVMRALKMCFWGNSTFCWVWLSSRHVVSLWIWGVTRCLCKSQTLAVHVGLRHGQCIKIWQAVQGERRRLWTTEQGWRTTVDSEIRSVRPVLLELCPFHISPTISDTQDHIYKHQIYHTGTNCPCKLCNAYMSSSVTITRHTEKDRGKDIGEL